MESILLIFRLLALSQVVLTISALLLYQRSKNGLLLSFLSIGFAAYLLQPLVLWGMGQGPLLYGVSFLATLIPALLWLVSNRLVDDRDEIPIWFFPLCLAYLALWYIGDLKLLSLNNAAVARIIFEFVPQLIKLGFVGHVVFMAISGRGSDLLEKRLRLRVPFALTASAIVGIVVLVELWAGNDVPMVLDTIGAVCMFLLALSANVFLLQWRTDFPLAETRRIIKNPSSGSEDEKFEETLALIERSMTVDRFYAGHSRTLADLAKQLGISAHRLRALINQNMGHKNFNQFLNRYRIEEAASRLHLQPDLPVLSIALDVGFRSISSFNAAFRSKYSKTPTEYRQMKSKQL